MLTAGNALLGRQLRQRENAKTSRFYAIVFSLLQKNLFLFYV